MCFKFSEDAKMFPVNGETAIYVKSKTEQKHQMFAYDLHHSGFYKKFQIKWIFKTLRQAFLNKHLFDQFYCGSNYLNCIYCI